MTDEEQAQLWARVAREHEVEPHPGLAGQRLRLHLAVHVVVERQLVEDSPAEVGITLQRLTGQGSTRHQAIHAVAEVASDEVLSSLSDGQRYDQERYVRRLRLLGR